MKKLTTIFFIFMIFLPMIIYLNPFTWGMRKTPHYEPSQKTNNLLHQLNKKHNLNIEIGSVIDTLWYFRDLNNNKITKLQNFELNLEEDSLNKNDIAKIESYIKDFQINFEHRKYFDSLNVILNYDSIIYKSKLK